MKRNYTTRTPFLDFKLSQCCECSIISFGWFPGVWILCADVSNNSVCSIFIGLLNNKNKWDGIARVFIQAKVWLKGILGQSERGVTGRGHVRVKAERLWRATASSGGLFYYKDVREKRLLFHWGSNPWKPSSQSYDPHNACCVLSEGPQFAHVGVCKRDGKSLA
jgi:hypothetical protein